MKIDIESLSYDELVALNHKIVERLKFLDAMHKGKSITLIKRVGQSPDQYPEYDEDDDY